MEEFDRVSFFLVLFLRFCKKVQRGYLGICTTCLLLLAFAFIYFEQYSIYYITTIGILGIFVSVILFALFAPKPSITIYWAGWS